MQTKVRSLIVLLIVLHTQVQCHNKVTLQSGNCTWNANYFSNFSFRIVNNTINVDMWLTKPLKAGLMAHLDFDIRVANAEHYQRLFKHDMNYCNIITATRIPLYRRWFRSILDKSNFCTSCPIPKAYYYLHNWAINGEMISIIFIAGNYRLNGSLFYGKYNSKREDYVLNCVVDGVLT